MPRSAARAASFRSAVSRIEPSGPESTQREAAFDILSKSLLEVVPDCDVKLVGSVAKGTDLRDHADIDIVVQVPQVLTTDCEAKLFSLFERALIQRGACSIEGKGVNRGTYLRGRIKTDPAEAPAEEAPHCSILPQGLRKRRHCRAPLSSYEQFDIKLIGLNQGASPSIEHVNFLQTEPYWMRGVIRLVKHRLRGNGCKPRSILLELVVVHARLDLESHRTAALRSDGAEAVFRHAVRLLADWRQLQVTWDHHEASWYHHHMALAPLVLDPMDPSNNVGSDMRLTHWQELETLAWRILAMPVLCRTRMGRRAPVEVHNDDDVVSWESMSDTSSSCYSSNSTCDEIVTGDCVLVVQPFGINIKGYLPLATGMMINVTYVGNPEKLNEMGWLFGELCLSSGWFPQDCVQGYSATDVLPDRYLASQAFRGKLSQGYLPLVPSIELTIVHAGVGSEEVGWLYGGYSSVAGWFPTRCVTFSQLLEAA